MFDIPDDVVEILTKWEQTHIIDYLSTIYEQKEFDGIVKQIKNMSHKPIINNLIKEVKNYPSTEKENTSSTNDAIYEPVNTIFHSTENTNDTYLNVGRDNLHKLAICILAGGQGTRMGLGPNESKGQLNIGLPSGKSIFQLVVEKTITQYKYSSKKTQPTILIMTSPLNHVSIIEFFEDHDFFGLSQNDIIFFQQETFPFFTPNGKLMIKVDMVDDENNWGDADSKRRHASIASGPNGNGGFYSSLVNCPNLLDILNSRGIEYIHTFSVDNALAIPADPRFFGYILSNNDNDASTPVVGNKVIWKSSWDESVGIILSKNGEVTVEEYSELYDPKHGIEAHKILTETDTSGRLKYGAANICNHLFSLSYIKLAANWFEENLSKSLHYARKTAGENIWSIYGQSFYQDAQPCLKMEFFIFDSFKLAPLNLIYSVDRDDEFAPMKNGFNNDKDSPISARNLLFKKWKKWINEIDQSIEQNIEISPLLGIEDCIDKDVILEKLKNIRGEGDIEVC